MSKVRLYGDTSGFVDLKAPDVAGDVTITLPNTTGPFATETYVDGAVSGLATETYVDAEIAAIPEIAGIGSNVVQTVKTDTFSTSTTGAFVEITGLNVTITPTAASSKILVLAHVPLSINSNDTRWGAGMSIFRSATNLSAPTSPSARSEIFGAMSLGADLVPVGTTAIFLDSPATTSSVTYNVRIIELSGATTMYVNRSKDDTDNANYGRSVATLTAIEVSA